MSKIQGVHTSGSIGQVIKVSGANLPPGTLWCDGSAVSRTTYAVLFANISTTYGVGDGSTTFNVPDLRGRIAVGKDNMGGTAANRMTSGGSGITGTTLGASGGAETHALSIAQLASHTHAQDAHTHATVVWGSGPTATPNQICGTTILANSGVPDPTYFAPTSATNQNTGSGTAHNNTQPSLILNKAICFQ